MNKFGSKFCMGKQIMNSKLIASAIVFAIAFGTPNVGFALERTSQNALTFFKRYESEFANNYRRLEECNRKLAVTDGSRADDLLIEAEEIMDRIQKRYDLLDDQFSFTASAYPADRNALRDGFAPIEDKFREIRNYYTDNFKNRGKSKKVSSVSTPQPVKANPITVTPISSQAKVDKNTTAYQEALAALKRPASNKANEQKAAKEAEMKKAAEEKKAAQEAAMRKAAEEKAAKEAEMKKAAEEKKAAMRKAAEEKAVQQRNAYVEPATTSNAYQEALAALKRPVTKKSKDQKENVAKPEVVKNEVKPNVISENDEDSKAYQQAKLEAEKMAKFAEELKIRAEEEKAKLEAKQALKEQERLKAEAVRKAKEEADAKAIAEARARLEAETKAKEEKAKAESEKSTILAKAIAARKAELLSKVEKNETAKTEVKEQKIEAPKQAEAKNAFEVAVNNAGNKDEHNINTNDPAYLEALSALKRDPKKKDSIKQTPVVTTTNLTTTNTSEMSDVLKAVEAKQAIEAEKIKVAIKEKEALEVKKAEEFALKENEKIAKLAADEDDDKLKISGVFSVEIRDREEKYKAQNLVGRPTAETTLPNDFNQFKFTLSYKPSENHIFTLDERYVQRERNELVRENYLDLSYWIKENDARSWKIMDSFQNSEYPDSDLKEYRDNKFEVTLERNEKENRKGTTSIGYQTRSYSNYNRSNFGQLYVFDSESVVRDNGSFYGEGKIDNRRYNNSNELDYSNKNIYLEYNKIYANKSELTIANTYDRRDYDHEASRLYRSSYYDNYIRVNYLLPTDGVFTYEIEGQHTKHDYNSDYERGYSELNLWVASKMKLTKKTRAQIDYRFVDNDENSKILAHKNNEIHFMIQKNVNDIFRVRFDHTYHNRDTVVGNYMNFDEHTSEAKLMWRMDNNMDLAWKFGYNGRIYDTTQYEDYRNYSTGLDLRYEKRNQYECRLTPSVRKIEFRNFYKEGMFEPVKNWEDEIQPSVEFEFSKSLKQDLRFTFNATYEKTYYRTYDVGMQDLIWNFGKPMEITEFIGKLEHSF